MQSSEAGSGTVGVDQAVAERVESLATWVNDIDARLRAAELATGDAKTAKELRRALEALTKHDPKLEQRVTNHVAVLNDRLTTLASTVSTTSAALAGKDGEIAGLRRELEEVEKRIGSLVRDLAGGVDPKEIAKLRSAVETLSAQRPGRSADSRVDALGGKVVVLAERVDTLAATVATTAASFTGREGELAALRNKLDEGSSRIESLTSDLRRLGRDDTLAQRLESLQDAVAKTRTDLATREKESAALRARIDEAYSRAGTAVSELQSSLGGLSTQVAALEQLPDATAASLDARSVELNGRIDGLAERLEQVATGVGSALAGLAQRDDELAALHGDVDEARSRVDTVVAEIGAALAALPEPGAVDPELDARLELLAGSVAGVTGRLEEIETASFDRAEAVASRASEVETALADVTNRIDAVERERDAAAAQLARADENWIQERDWVRRQLERLADAHAAASQAAEIYGPQLDELRIRLAGMESGREAVSSEIARVSETLDAERASLQVQLDALTTTVAEAVSATENGEPAQLVVELAGRLGDIEGRGAAVASELARVTAFWASEIDSIETRLDQVTAAAGKDAAPRDDGETERLLGALAARLDAMERDRDTVAAEVGQAFESLTSERVSLAGRLDEVTAKLGQVETTARSAAAAAATPSDDLLAQLHVLVDGLRMRVASSEQELATLASTRDVGPRLDELNRRIESVERAAPAVVMSTPDPAAGDGRFRLELRALELRMEHAEAAARENREAVLVQLERLASRVEWRLQRLETELEPEVEVESAGAQVVPIRGGADL